MELSREQQLAFDKNNTMWMSNYIDFPPNRSYGRIIKFDKYPVYS